MGKRRTAGVPIKTSGSGPKGAPIGDHGGIGNAGNQNAPGIEHVELAPSDGHKFDKTFGHLKE